MISHGQIWIKKEGKVGKSPRLKILTKDCEKEHLLSVEKENGETAIIPKHTLIVFYEPEGTLHQGELFNKAPSKLEKLKLKYLKP